MTRPTHPPTHLTTVLCRAVFSLRGCVRLSHRRHARGLRDQGGGIHATAKKEICTAEYVSSTGGITREKRERMYHGYDDDDESRFLIVKHSGPLCMYCRRRQTDGRREGRGETHPRELWGGRRRNEQTGITHTHCAAAAANGPKKHSWLRIMKL